jgi:hypothetical protein
MQFTLKKIYLAVSTKLALQKRGYTAYPLLATAFS